MGKRDLPKYNRIKDELAKQGKTQMWLAEKMDRDFVTITRYCNNVRQPSIPVLYQIAKVLKVSPRDLLNE